jgi:hypothetical protein
MLLVSRCHIDYCAVTGHVWMGKVGEYGVDTFDAIKCALPLCKVLKYHDYVNGLITSSRVIWVFVKAGEISSNQSGPITPCARAVLNHEVFHSLQF